VILNDINAIAIAINFIGRGGRCENGFEALQCDELKFS
jgi:hypothetical protein